MRLFKRILIGLALLLMVGLILSAGGLWMAYDTPDWYQPRVLSADERAAAAQRAEDVWIEAQSRLAEAHARQVAATTQKLADGEPTAPVRISFSADELNAFFEKWSKLNNWERKFEQYMADPQIVLHDGRLILAGKLKQVEILDGLVASVHFRPRITETGALDLQLVQVLGGSLPMPEAVWHRQKQRLTDAVRNRLPALQHQARLNSQGTANTEAVSAAMGRLFLQIMNHEAGEPVVFVPIVGRGSVPVRVTGVEIAPDPQTSEQRLTLTVVAMTPDQRQEFINRVREPYRTATALNQ